MEAMRDAQNNKQGALRIYADVCLRILLRVRARNNIPQLYAIDKSAAALAIIKRSPPSPAVPYTSGFSLTKPLPPPPSSSFCSFGGGY